MATERVCKDCGKLQDIKEFPKGKNKERVFIRYSCTDCIKAKRKELNKKYYKKRCPISKRDMKKLEQGVASEEYIET